MLERNLSSSRFAPSRVNCSLTTRGTELKSATAVEEHELKTVEFTLLDPDFPSGLST